MSKIPSFNSPAEFDHLMLEPVHSMMRTGIRINRDKLEEFRTEAISNWTKYQADLNKISGFPVNVGSNKQCRILLYKELKMRKRRNRGAKAATTDEDALRSIMAEANDKVESLSRESSKTRWRRAAICSFLILKVRGEQKKLTSYLGIQIKKGDIVGESALYDDDNRIRGTISVGGTETARFSHSKTLWGTGVNLATVPRDLRSMYIPDDGYEMAEFDLNRGESWIYSHLSEDPELIRIHTEGLDFHAETAAVISSEFGESLDVDWIIKHKEDKAYKIRFVAKKLNHAYAYRMGPREAAKNVNQEAEDTGITITTSQAKGSRQKWLEKYFMIPTWWKGIEKKLSKNFTMRTPYGRIHIFYDAWGDQLFKAASAYVPQSTSVDYLNRGFLKVFHLFEKTGAWGLNVLAQTHDSILVQYKVEHRDEVIPSIIEAMTSELTIKGRTFSIPIEAQHGRSWGELQ